MERQTMTVRELASYLGVHQDTIYAMVRHKEIPHVKLRNRILFTKVAVDRWIAEEENKNTK